MSTTIALSNAAIVGSLYEAFGRGDIPTIVESLAPDCEWNVMGSPLVPHGGKYIGKETYQFFAKLNEDFEFTEFTVNSINEISENEVVALGRLTFKARATGRAASSNWAMHWRLEDGKAKYFQDFYDSALAYTLL